MVLIALIITAVALMALLLLGVLGIRPKLRRAMPAAGPDQAAPG
jgi:hypothetical protein